MHYQIIPKKQRKIKFKPEIKLNHVMTHLHDICYLFIYFICHTIITKNIGKVEKEGARRPNRNYRTFEWLGLQELLQARAV